MMELDRNRAKILWKNWEKLENELRQLGGKSGEQEKEIARQKYDFLRNGLCRLSERPIGGEKPYIAMISSVIIKLEKQLYPNRLLRYFQQVKALLYDRPKLLNELRVQRAENLISLKSTFARQGLKEISKLLDYYLDYDKQQVNFTLTGKMDDLRSLSIEPVFKQDERGLFILAEENLKLWGSVDPLNDMSISLPGECLLNREQMMNLVEQRPVYLFPGLNNQTFQEEWVRATKSPDFGEFKLEISSNDQLGMLERALHELAQETKVYKLTSAETLLELRLGNQFHLNALHDPNKRFFIEADPSGKKLVIRNDFGKQISKDDLLKSFHDFSSPETGFKPNKYKGKDQSNDLDQGLSV